MVWTMKTSSTCACSTIVRQNLFSKKNITTAMENSNKIQILTKFSAYLRLLTVYNHKTIIHRNWRCIVHNILYLLCSTMIILLPFIYISLGIWYLFENDADFKKFVVALPLLLGLLQIEVTFIAMLMKNHIINKTINQLQRVVDQRR